VNLLRVLDQNPGLRWADLVGTVELEPEGNPELEPLDDGTEPEDELANFQI
jgi:hypothetical protein